MRIGALVSTGKDSLLAAWLARKGGHELACIITIQSRNPESYMFHTPNVGLAALQAEAMDLPMVSQGTMGRKEEELADLRKALQKAKKMYGIEGVSTGALFSSYQKERIDGLCRGLGLAGINPLWHMDQEKELHMLLAEGFTFVMTRIAAEGLDASWLGKPITEKEVKALAVLAKKHGINMAGEGGEYESLVLDCPLFRKRIEIIESRIITENEHTAELAVTKARLSEKGHP